MIEATVLVPSIKPHDTFIEIGMSITEFLIMCKDHDVLVKSLTIEIGELTTAYVTMGIGFDPSKTQPFVVTDENTNQ